MGQKQYLIVHQNNTSVATKRHVTFLKRHVVFIKTSRRFHQNNTSFSSKQHVTLIKTSRHFHQNITSFTSKHQVTFRNNSSIKRGHQIYTDYEMVGQKQKIQSEKLTHFFEKNWLPVGYFVFGVVTVLDKKIVRYYIVETGQ